MKIRLIHHGYVVLLLAGLLAGCAATSTVSSTPVAATVAPATAVPASGGMGHSNMPGATAPYDATFIDGMIQHHQGAITMANQALKSAERAELKQLAEAIIAAQQAEISQLQTWRNAWYPGLATTMGMGMAMGPMMVADGATPFDQRFIEAMIPHHESAVAMARDALQRAEHQELKDMAQMIINAQMGEIDQMRQWKQSWYPGT